MSTTTKPDLSITTTDHPNVARLRDSFGAFGRGDLEAVRASQTPDCVWTNVGTSPIAGTYKGWDAIVGMFGALLAATDGTFSMSLITVLANDTHAVAVYDATSTVKGATETQRFVLIDDMTPDGKVKATQVLAYDQAAADAHIAR